MALTDAQKADCRRWCGYPQVGASHPTDANRDFVFGWVLPGVHATLTGVLNDLLPENESILINTYLTPLAAREAEIQGAADNLDTIEAAVWKRDPEEVDRRVRLFNYLRKQMCGFLGIPPGPELQTQTKLVRC